MLGLPALPVLCKSHALLASLLQPFGPLPCGSWPAAERVVEVFGDFFYLLLVVVFCNLNVCRYGRRLQLVCGKVVQTAGEQCEGQGRSQGRGRRKEQTRILCCQLRSNVVGRDLQSDTVVEGTIRMRGC